MPARYQWPFLYHCLRSDPPLLLFFSFSFLFSRCMKQIAPRACDLLSLSRPHQMHLRVQRALHLHILLNTPPQEMSNATRQINLPRLKLTQRARVHAASPFKISPPRSKADGWLTSATGRHLELLRAASPMTHDWEVPHSPNHPSNSHLFASESPFGICVAFLELRRLLSLAVSSSSLLLSA